MRPALRLVLIAAVVVGVLAGGSGGPALGGSPYVASTLGIRDENGVTILVEVFLAVAPGESAEEAAAAALRAAGARPLSEAEAARFQVPEFGWPQFFGRQRRGEIVQYYNPDGDPTGGQALEALLKVQQTYSTVDGSLLRITFGGVTSRKPGGVDEFSDVGWRDFGCGPLLGLAGLRGDVATGNIRAGDFLLNSNRCIRWFTVVPPPPPPPPGRDPPPPGPPRVCCDVETVMLHETGHVVGLLGFVGHSVDPGSIMYPDYLGARRQLDPFSIEELRTIYPAEGHPAHPRHPVHPEHPAPPIQASPIAFLGDPAPGGGTLDFDFEALDVNDRGDVAFATDLLVDGERSGEGVFRRSGGVLSELARSAEPAPGGGTFGLGILGRAAINDAGDVAFVFLLESFEAGVYRAPAGRPLEAVVAPGETPAPGGGVFQGAVGSADIGADGRVVFAGVVEADPGLPFSPGLSAGVYSAGAGGGIEAVAAPGTHAPGGGVFDHAASPSVNGAGDVAFSGHRPGDPPTVDFDCESPGAFGCNAGIYVRRGSGGELEEIARRGDAAPGGGTFELLVGPLINDRGDVLFQGFVNLGDPEELSRKLFLHTGGVTRVAAASGDPVPFSKRLLLPDPEYGSWALNEAGDIAFPVLLEFDGSEVHRGPFDTAVVATRNGRLNLVARTETEVKGVGVVVGVQPPFSDGSVELWHGVGINDAGQVLFQATLTDGRGVLLLTR